jgi:uncharacterized protein YyaL (SSP411 family)
MPRLREMANKGLSLYLAQHADNPVEWWAWGDDALDEARRLSKPIFLSVGYAACHWCHVMAHESFEDPDIARLLNESFVAIKVDREERPDVDALYMAATQLQNGHGGWPMSVFLVPDGRPFMAGTYYPPVDRNGQVGFTRLVLAMADAWTNQRDAVERQATELSEGLNREVSFIDHLASESSPIDLRASRQRLRDVLVEQADRYGGFGGAPKFPRPSYVEALLDFDDDEAIDAVKRTLEAMSRGGIYDHIRGGFARYSVDDRWRVPHFEKMLSDQALLARAYLRAAKTRRGQPHWREVALDTIAFVLDDLSVEGGFGSSLDADAANVEGSHVTWSVDEVVAALVDADCIQDLVGALERWRIESPGAFEGRSIPRLADDAPFMTPPSLCRAREALRASRSRRPQPSRDEKVILEWNAMFASALLLSAEDEHVTRALALLHSLMNTHFAAGAWWRTELHNAHASTGDVAWLCDALVDAFEVTGDPQWLEYASVVASYLLEHHWDGEVPSAHNPDAGAGLFSQSDLVTDLLVRPKEIFDGATPSGHAVGTRALARLALCTGDNDLLSVAQRLVTLAGPLIANHPGAVPDLVEAAGFALDGVEIVIPGDSGLLVEHVRSLPMSRTVLITGTGPSALLAGRTPGLAYVCRGGVCQLPVSSVEDLDNRLSREGL